MTSTVKGTQVAIAQVGFAIIHASADEARLKISDIVKEASHELQRVPSPEFDDTVIQYLWRYHPSVLDIDTTCTTFRIDLTEQRSLRSDISIPIPPPPLIYHIFNIYLNAPEGQLGEHKEKEATFFIYYSPNHEFASELWKMFSFADGLFPYESLYSIKYHKSRSYSAWRNDLISFPFVSHANRAKYRILLNPPLDQPSRETWNVDPMTVRVPLWAWSLKHLFLKLEIDKRVEQNIHSLLHNMSFFKIETLSLTGVPAGNLTSIEQTFGGVQLSRSLPSLRKLKIKNLHLQDPSIIGLFLSKHEVYLTELHLNIPTSDPTLVLRYLQAGSQYELRMLTKLTLKLPSWRTLCETHLRTFHLTAEVTLKVVVLGRSGEEYRPLTRELRADYTMH